MGQAGYKGDTQVKFWTGYSDTTIGKYAEKPQKL